MFDYAAHSDLLVYWTGSDLDKNYDPCWFKEDSSKTNCKPKLEEEYLARLRSILKYGLWMTVPRAGDENADEEVGLYLREKVDILLPKEVPRVCFTELRLSEARTHAKRYGRLGIGVKRPFVFDRGGRPVIYCGPKDNRARDYYLRACDALFIKEKDRALLHFLKPMHSGKGEPYDFYAESEWRIIYTDLLDPRSPPVLEKSGYPATAEYQRCSVCVRANPRTSAYIDSLPDIAKQEAPRLRYLLPLDGWLSCIVYPSVSLKRRAQQECIREEIRRIKNDRNCRANDNQVEKGNWPVEMDLDLCQNL